MKEEISKLRTAGCSYREIASQLGCAKSTVWYYCGKGQKDKLTKCKQKSRKKAVISTKIEIFQYKQSLRYKTKDFQRHRDSKQANQIAMPFRWEDVVKKFGWETKCYLTGRLINLQEPKKFHFDHIIPKSRGGNNSLENLGITCKEANQAKCDSTMIEFLLLCKEILEYNGYIVNGSDPAG